jgi:multidrug transporter EmrE-like cation transporter
VVLSCIFQKKEGMFHAACPMRFIGRLSVCRVGVMIRLVLMSVLLGSVGQIMMKTGSDRLGQFTLAPATFFSDLMRVLRVPEFWMAMLLFGISSLIWVKVLSKSELTRAYPLGSMSYVVVVILSALLLNEALTLNKLLGAAVIMAGIVIMHR